MNTVSCGQAIIIRPREDVGVALGAQVVQVVTNHSSPEGSLLYTVFTKKFQKRSKKGGGYPLLLTGQYNAPAN